VSSSSSTTIDSIETLNQKEEHLEKRRELIEKNIEVEHAKAKKYYSEKKVNLAKTCLKKKKMYEKNVSNSRTLFRLTLLIQLEDLGNLIMKVNEQKIMLENAQTTAETLKAIAGATKATKSVLKDNKIEDVDKLMDEIAADTDMMRDISDRIAEPSPFMAEIDDDDLMAELEEFNQEDEAERLETELMKPNTITTGTCKWIFISVSRNEISCCRRGRPSVSSCTCKQAFPSCQQERAYRRGTRAGSTGSRAKRLIFTNQKYPCITAY